MLHASKILESVKSKTDNFDQKVGVDIIRHALRIPTKTIANNAGVEGAVVVGKVLENNDYNYGYNAAKGRVISYILDNNS